MGGAFHTLATSTSYTNLRLKQSPSTVGLRGSSSDSSPNYNPGLLRLLFPGDENQTITSRATTTAAAIAVAAAAEATAATGIRYEATVHPGTPNTQFHQRNTGPEFSSDTAADGPTPATSIDVAAAAAASTSDIPATFSQITANYNGNLVWTCTHPKCGERLEVQVTDDLRNPHKQLWHRAIAHARNKHTLTDIGTHLPQLGAAICNKCNKPWTPAGLPIHYRRCLATPRPPLSVAGQGLTETQVAAPRPRPCKSPPVITIKGKSAVQACASITASILENIADAMEHDDAEEIEKGVEALTHLPDLLSDSSGKIRGSGAINRTLAPLLCSDDTAAAVITAYNDKQPVVLRPFRAENRTPNAIQEAAIRKSSRLVRVGRLGAALRVVEEMENASAPLVIGQTEGLRLQLLHPDASARDILPVAAQVSSPYDLRLSQIDIFNAFRSLPKATAGAMSGWTCDFIHQLGTDNPRLQNSTRLVFNLILRGKGGDPTPWVTSRLIALAKPDEGIRPIAIGEAWFRLLARAVASQLASKAAPTLLPLQYGIGVEGGAEIVCHLFRSVADHMAERDRGFDSSISDPEDPLVIAAVDCTNAFNTITRQSFLHYSQTHHPEFVPFICWAYGTASPLILNSGSQVCSSATGVRQGDPMGSVLFSLGLQPTLVALSSAFPDVIVRAYIDDISLSGKRSVVARALHFLREQLNEIGITMNPRKTKIWDTTLSTTAQRAEATQEFGFPFADDCMRILGAPFGEDCMSRHLDLNADSVQGMFESYLGKIRHSVDALPRLPAQQQLLLLRACVNLRPLYLTRILPPSVTASFTRQVDQEIDRAIAEIVKTSGTPLPQHCRSLRHLNTDMGCGIRYLYDTRASTYASSALVGLHHVFKHETPLWCALIVGGRSSVLGKAANAIKGVVGDFIGFNESGINFRDPNPRPTPEDLPDNIRSRANRSDFDLDDSISNCDADLRLAASVTRHLSISTARPSTQTSATQPHTGPPLHLWTQKKLQLKADARRAKALFDWEGPNSHALPYALAAYTLSGSGIGTGNWLRTIPAHGGLTIADCDFSEALRLRLGLPLNNSDIEGDNKYRCKCQREGAMPMSSVMTSHHCLSCPALSGLRIARHDDVVHLLAEFIRSALGRSGQELSITPRTIRSHDTDAAWRPDIQIRIGPRELLIDVVVVNPACPSYTAINSFSKVGVAADHEETRKLRKMAASGDGGDHSERFPFVLEATGRLGTTAKNFQKLIAEQAGRASTNAATARRTFDNGLAMSMVRHTGRMQRAGRSLLSRYTPSAADYPTPPPHMPTQLPVNDILASLGIHDPAAGIADEATPPSAHPLHPHTMQHHNPSDYWGTVGNIHMSTEEAACMRCDSRTAPGVVMDYLDLCWRTDNSTQWVAPSYWLSNTLRDLSQEFSVLGVQKRLGPRRLEELGRIIRRSDRVIMPLFHDGQWALLSLLNISQPEVTLLGPVSQGLNNLQHIIPSVRLLIRAACIATCEVDAGVLAHTDITSATPVHTSAGSASSSPHNTDRVGKAISEFAWSPRAPSTSSSTHASDSAYHCALQTAHILGLRRDTPVSMADVRLMEAPSEESICSLKESVRKDLDTIKDDSPRNPCASYTRDSGLPRFFFRPSTDHLSRPIDSHSPYAWETEGCSLLPHKKEARNRRSVMETNCIIIYTDGSSRSSEPTGQAGWGFIVTEHEAGRRLSTQW